MHKPHRPRTAWPSNHRALVPAFTLIELMIVVAIIAVLIALMLPSLARARQQAYRVRCASNLHQIGMGIFYYTSDHRVSNGHLPNFWGERAEEGAGNYWASQIAPYLKIKQSRVGTRNGLLRCPADEVPVYVVITGSLAGRRTDRQAKIRADSGASIGVNQQPGKSPSKADQGLVLVEPVSYMGNCERTRDGRRWAEIRKPHCQVLISEVNRDAGGRELICFVWFPITRRRGGGPAALRRHYGGANPNRNGSNWLFADLHVAWTSATHAAERLYRCQEFKPVEARR